ERCNDKILKLLLDEEITTGLILSENNIETQRIINNISIEKPTPILQELFNTSEDMLTREYSIIQHGTIRLFTKESYPLSYFREI
ncbi:MAG: chorismate pyruvate-lyase family protein, partial [Methanobrevibacter sp.]|nr:chorismate pyruvate-lyase family protein [Methanobrevibacter sp.]